jgi:hypothetical protein
VPATITIDSGPISMPSYSEPGAKIVVHTNTLDSIPVTMWVRRPGHAPLEGSSERPDATGTAVFEVSDNGGAWGEDLEGGIAYSLYFTTVRGGDYDPTTDTYTVFLPGTSAGIPLRFTKRTTKIIGLSTKSKRISVTAKQVPPVGFTVKNPGKSDHNSAGTVQHVYLQYRRPDSKKWVNIAERQIDSSQKTSSVRVRFTHYINHAHASNSFRPGTYLLRVKVPRTISTTGKVSTTFTLRIG